MSSPDSNNTTIYPVKENQDSERKPLVSKSQYEEMYRQSVENSEEFWTSEAAGARTRSPKLAPVAFDPITSIPGAVAPSAVGELSTTVPSTMNPALSQVVTPDLIVRTSSEANASSVVVELIA